MPANNIQDYRIDGSDPDLTPILMNQFMTTLSNDMQLYSFSMKKYSQFQLVAILTPFVFSFAFGLDIYIPMLPQMIEIFDTTPALVQLTMSLFLFITGLGQLFIGPLADRFGRKPTLYASALFFAFGALCCAHAGDIAQLIVARVLTSIGACGMLVTSFAMVRDLYSNDESAKMYSLLKGAIGISPTIAPILGGYLYFFFGWQSVFYFLSAIGIFAFFITKRFIQETLPTVNQVKIDWSLFRRYKAVVSNPKFMVFAAMTGLAEAVFFCFLSVSPFIIITLHGVPVHEFGYYFALFGCVISLGGLASGKVLEKIGILPTLKVGILLMFIGGSSMLAWHMLAASSLTGFLLPMIIACMGAMFIIGGSASAALEPFEAIAGTAAAALGAGQFSISALLGSLLLLFPITNATYAISILLIAITTTAIFALRQRMKACQILSS